MSEKIYLVYDEKHDVMEGILDSESAMIQELARCPEFKIERTIKSYYENTEDKKLFIERNEEIYECYYKWNSPFHVHPFSLHRERLIPILKELDRLKAESSTTLPPENNSDYAKLTVRQCALMHFYLQEAKLEPIFGQTKTKKSEINELASKYSKSPNTFTQEYNKLFKHPDNRTNNINDLQTILSYLPMPSEAHQLISNELEIAKKRNPLT